MKMPLLNAHINENAPIKPAKIQEFLNSWIKILFPAIYFFPSAVPVNYTSNIVW